MTRWLAYGTLTVVLACILAGCSRDSNPPEPTPAEAQATPTNTATPEPTSTATPTAIPTAQAQPAPAATPEPTSTPSPTPTATPEPTSTPSPTPTGTPSPEPITHPSDILDWFDDPPDEAHSLAAESIGRMWHLDPDLGAGVARLLWVADGITWYEESVLETLSSVIHEDPELVRTIVKQEPRPYLLRLSSESAKKAADYPWLTEGLDAREVQAFVGIALIAKHNPSLAERVLSDTSLADGVARAEAERLYALSHWALQGPELTDRVLRYPWLGDGVDHHEEVALSSLYDFAERGGVEAAQQVMDYQWLADDLTWDERQAIGLLVQLVEDDPEASRHISHGTLAPYLLELGPELAKQEGVTRGWLTE